METESVLLKDEIDMIVEEMQILKIKDKNSTSKAYKMILMEPNLT